MPKDPKRPYPNFVSWKKCSRCKRPGHNGPSCPYKKNTDGRIIETELSKRVSTDGRESREYSYIPDEKHFHNAYFQDLKLETIDLINIDIPAVYEIGVRKLQRKDSVLGYQNIVTYVGTTSDVHERMLDHFHGFRVFDGGIRSSTIKEYIDDARDKGNTVIFRYAQKATPKEAELAEAELLQKVDYPWNLLDNGKTRRFGV